ncbi:hypothetical protein [Goodfellowiella coeruleoviolacea]|uniref:Uncharacterized protein n=1 Tax=Goodfellowiella coeruleoviolacea TaxID=334858 RepID=A0AAE3GC66_9PSEU|nr:hypothetical protein [Goodfellowiella coeruleoviolacea]MCP2164414.1 hypothetical protein [Goodfellowiella coeruleoviolacea]
MSSTVQRAEVDQDTDGQPSCYLLEFSVGGGGARHADVHAYGDLDSVRASLERRGGVDAYLVLWYGAVLHLWVVRHGAIVEGVDLHPFLRTGDERHDRSVARLLASREGRDGESDVDWPALFDSLCEACDWDARAALPLLTHLFELHDRGVSGDAAAAEELAALTESIEEGELPDEFAITPADHSCLDLDWAAIGRAVAPLKPPVLGTGEVHVRWAEDCAPHPESFLRQPFGRAEFHAGVNDLENGEDEYPEGHPGAE